jgi:hypothetical protein
LRAWRQDLEQAGFRPSGPTGTFRLDGITFELKGDWPVLSARREKGGSGPSGARGDAAGLWKSVHDAGDGHVRRLFEFPLSAIELEGLAPCGEVRDPAVSPFAATLSWALETVDGTLPGDWSPPERKIVEEWIPPDGLTVRAGGFVRQGSLLHGPGCLAIRFPILPEVPEGLSAPRKRWLEELLRDAQDRWRMVRMVLPGSRALAEVDLSGAPACILQPLFGTALDALRWVVAWVGPPAAFICDSNMSSEVLESFVNP